MYGAKGGGTPISLAWARVNAYRMAHHHLLSPAPRAQLTTVVGEVCGIQAQLMSAAELALRVRVRRLRPEDVRHALWRDRSLVKTWFVRGSVHLVPSADVGTFLEALRPREARMLAWLATNGLSRAEAEAIVGEILAALRDGPLLRRELAEHVGRRLGAKARRWVASSWGGVLRLAGVRGLVCFGPGDGKEISFVRTDDWLPHRKAPEAKEAAADLLRRYLAAFGPATRGDYGLWTNLPAEEVGRVWREIEKELVRVDVEGRSGDFLLAQLGRVQHARPPQAVVRLLPNFDVFLLGHRDKNHLVDAAHYKRVYRKAGWISPAVLADGRVEGTWSIERKPRRAILHVALLAAASGGVREGIALEAEDIARFLGLSEVQVAYAPAR